MTMEDREGSRERERLAEAVDEACAPVVDEVWQRVLPDLRAALERREAEQAVRYRPTPEEIVERLRANGLEDPGTGE